MLRQVECVNAALKNAGGDTFLLLMLTRLGVRKLESIFAVLIATMAVAFGVIYAQSGVNQAEVVRSLVEPRLKCAHLRSANTSLLQPSALRQWLALS